MRRRKLLLIIFALIIFLQFSAIAKADVASDIAAGVPLLQIIKSALNAGMTLEGAITAIIKEGIGLKYAMRDWLEFAIDYNHKKRNSNIDANNYQENSYTFAVNIAL